jgi:hypothetical protein
LPRLHRRALIALQIVFAGAVAWFAGRAIHRQWAAIEAAELAIHPRWSWIILASLIILATYLLLIALWVIHLRDWGQRVSFLTAARIWFISSLGRYVPGKVASLGTMAVMAERRGASAVAAVGSSIVVMLIGIVAGLAVVMVTGARVVRALLQGNGLIVPGWAFSVVVAVAIGSLLIAPLILPRLAGMVARISGRETILPSLPASSVWLVAGSRGF